MHSFAKYIDATEKFCNSEKNKKEWVNGNQCENLQVSRGIGNIRD